MMTVVGPQGEVVVPEDIREQLGVQPGWTAVQVLVDGHLEVYFAPPEHDRSLLGVLRPYVKATLSDEELREASESAWAEDAAERDARIVREWRSQSGESSDR